MFPDPIHRRGRGSAAVRRGSSYIAVLGATLIVASLSYGGLLAVRNTVRVATDFGDAAAARRCAEAGIELGRLWIAQDANWRDNRPDGVWVANQPLLDGTYTLEVIDTLDGDLGNRSHDPIRMTVTAAKGRARHKLEISLLADPVPLPSLASTLHSAGELEIGSGRKVYAGGAKVSTDKKFKNNGVVNGNVEADQIDELGTVNGTVTAPSPSKGKPDSQVAERYAALGTLINPGNKINLDVLGPGTNPWGSPNAEGVYVVRTNNDFTLRNCRVYGTLVVFCSGRVTLEGQVLFQPYRADYPSLIIVGDARFEFTAGLLAMSELLSLKNFNPPGAPYQGSSDNDILDSYPSEIQGLVHVTGRVELKKKGTVRGTLLGQASGSKSVLLDVDYEFVYNPLLYANPPQWYTSQVFMRPVSGSFRQVSE